MSKNVIDSDGVQPEVELCNFRNGILTVRCSLRYIELETGQVFVRGPTMIQLCDGFIYK